MFLHSSRFLTLCCSLKHAVQAFIPSDGVSEEGQPGPPQTGSCVHTWDAEGPSSMESFVFLSAGADGQLMDSCDHCDGSTLELHFCL